ncbi:hypothetical protein K504DRAFT_424579 [Pleomassaria siparia CBS 279.74]|uniref:Ubiquitin 3 binding protein But2 C-terminal domain-containing protein n=1 Tax=Pleomassaria siparia CBS 279.74 TaxID=1314801 RepID=A0A6G1KME1_9PLEO|nr:hypothetical protein K504DRAFT_424579 [Pleomassaria siparia CBS 279.74]
MRSMLLLAVLGGIQAVTAGMDLIDRQFPKLIVLVSSTTPTTVIGTKFEGLISPDVYTEVLFDVPSKVAQLCRVNFHIAREHWAIMGDQPFIFNISTLDRSVNKDKDTWKDRPSPVHWVATVQVTYLGKVTFLNGGDGRVSCAKGKPASFLLHPTAEVGLLNWYELARPLHGIVYEMHN